jgi:UDP-N-acetylglucosamine--N-acetylmuramyl-(pentapeptide) pyrophosphoryl-undecaprenol N-acetylglucosamine transferase
MSARPIVLAAGGTGGHLFPAEALASELIARGREVALVTDRRGQAFGDRLAGIAVHRIRAGRMNGNLLKKAVGVAELALGTLEAKRLLRRLEPAAVVGFGGYPSVPTVYAAIRLGLPTVLHEQNAILGRANRLLAARVKGIAASFIETPLALARARVEHTGNPVRPAICALRGAPYQAPAGDEPVEILVLGGSQGARIFSEIVPTALKLLPEALRRRLRVTQQARQEDLERARAAYQEAGVEPELAPFFHDVPSRLSRAHLAIARSGASTCAELTVVGRPAILVPYPFAVDDHQTANARALERGGAAWVVPQPEFSAAALARRLEELVADPSRLAEAASAAHRQGRPDAASRLADFVLSAAGSNGGEASPRRAAA